MNKMPTESDLREMLDNLAKTQKQGATELTEYVSLRNCQFSDELRFAKNGVKPSKMPRKMKKRKIGTINWRKKHYPELGFALSEENMSWIRKYYMRVYNRMFGNWF